MFGGTGRVVSRELSSLLFCRSPTHKTAIWKDENLSILTPGPVSLMGPCAQRIEQYRALPGTFIPAVMDVDVQAEPAKVQFPDWTN